MNNVIVINGSGKTGTSSLYKSFNNLNNKIMVQHSHNLFAREEKGPGFSKNLCTFEEINKLLGNKNIQLTIIDSFRDPIDRKISSFFENIVNSKKFKDKEQVLQIYNSQGIDPIINKFNKSIIQIEHDQSCSQWEDAFQMNIFNYPFDYNNKYLHVKNNGINFLLLRFDQIKKWESIIQTELKIYDFKLENINSSKDKWYCDIYREFKNKYKIPRKLFDKVFNQYAKFINYFYTQKEIHEFRNKWLK